MRGHGHVVFWGRIGYWFEYKRARFQEIQNLHLKLVYLQS